MFTLPFSFLVIAPSYTRVQGFCSAFWWYWAFAVSVAVIDIAIAIIEVIFFIVLIFLRFSKRLLYKPLTMTANFRQESKLVIIPIAVLPTNITDWGLSKNTIRIINEFYRTRSYHSIVFVSNHNRIFAYRIVSKKDSQWITKYMILV